MENLRLGVSAVQHDMKREETVEEVEKNTEWEHHTPKRKAAGSNPVQGAKKGAKTICFGSFLHWWRQRQPPAMPGEKIAYSEEKSRKRNVRLDISEIEPEKVMLLSNIQLACINKDGIFACFNPQANKIIVLQTSGMG